MKRGMFDLMFIGFFVPILIAIATMNSMIYQQFYTNAAEGFADSPEAMEVIAPLDGVFRVSDSFYLGVMIVLIVPLYRSWRISQKKSDLPKAILLFIFALLFTQLGVVIHWKIISTSSIAPEVDYILGPNWIANTFTWIIFVVGIACLVLRFGKQDPSISEEQQLYKEYLRGV